MCLRQAFSSLKASGSCYFSMMPHIASRLGPIIGLTSHDLRSMSATRSRNRGSYASRCLPVITGNFAVYICVLLGTIGIPSVARSGVCFVSSLNSLQFFLRAIFAIPRPFTSRSPQFNFFVPPSRRTTTNRSSSFSHLSGSRDTRSARIASNAKVKEEEGGT